MKKPPQDSNTTVTSVWCLQEVKYFILKLLINGSFWCGTKLLQFLYAVLFFPFSWSCWWHAGEVAVNRTNYQGCQFDVHLLQCQISTDISRIVKWVCLMCPELFPINIHVHLAHIWWQKYKEKIMVRMAACLDSF